MRSNVLKAGLLAGWLWLPSLVVLTTDQLASTRDAIGLLGFSLFLLLCPLVLLPRPRHYFLALTPFALLAGPFAYLTLAYHSVPGDALISATWNTEWAQTRQVLASFGWLVWLVPLSVLAYVLLALSIDRTWKLGAEARKRLFAGLLMAAMLAMVTRVTMSQQLRLPPFFEHATANLAFPSGLAMSLTRMYHQQNKTASFASVHGRSAAQSQPVLVVFALGESLRYDHLQLNGYKRPTTPNLAALGPDLLSFSDVASTANWTNAAVPNIVARHIGKQEATLVKTFREAGFQTAWISNQERSPYARDANVVEQGHDAQDFHLRTDANLLPMFSSFVRQAGPRQFVLLHMIGSHIPYEERYGADSRVFTPTLSDLGINAPQPVDREATVNSYDNTVIEADKFLSRVIATLSQETRPAILLFTSDHGENLFDDKRGLFMHTQHPATRFDTHVPMLVWMNAAYRESHPQIAAALQANRDRKITHTQIFPSLLEIADIDWDGRDSRESFASPSFTEGPRKVLVDLQTTADYETLK